MNLNNLDSITQSIEELTMKQGRIQNEYDTQIAKLESEKFYKVSEITKELDAAIEIQKSLMKDIDKIDTQNFKNLRWDRPDPKKKAHWKLELPKGEALKILERELVSDHIGLVKVEADIKPIQNDIKQLIADGVFHVTEEGLVIDDNGVALHGLKATLKEPKIKWKVVGNDLG